MAINPVKARGQVSLAKLYDGTNGKDGKDGAQGVPGAPGADGKTTYVHVAYADSADGKTNFSTTDPTNRKYIGVLTDFSINDSTDYTLYTWSLAQGPVGPTGSTGATGPKGADGLTTYVHVAYANSADGNTDFSTTDPVGKSYIGVLTDTTPADSTDYTKYTWSLVKGSDGAQGPQGVQGPKGTDGKTTYVHFSYANSADGSKDFSTTDTTGRNYIGVFTDTNINDSTNYTDYTWSLVQGPTGPTGNTGAVGPKGADGRTTYVHVAYADSVDGLTNFSTTDATGRKYIGVLTDFNMNDSTTPGDYTWSLAQGPAGPTGNTGATGAKGADGRTTYVHVAYANSDNGASNFSTTDPTGRAYIGVLTDFNINDSTNYADYTWSLAKGADGANGAQGVQGPKGTDGRTTYVHFAYSNSADGTSNFSVSDPTGRTYIGTYTDFTLNDSTTPSDYTWSLVKGADGANGAQGIQGPKGADGKNTYVHFAYAGNATGTTNFSVSDPTGRPYIGVLTDFNINDSTTPSDYTWSLAQGPTGPTGANGAAGPKGADGLTTYVHIAYAGNATGTSNFSTTDPTGRTYIGVLTDTTLPDSTNPADYSWSLIKGADGAQGPQGIQGPVGANGKNTYVHFAYANSANGATSFSTTDPTNRAYIGVLTDFNLNDSTNYADYTWSLAKGADGAQGIQGPVGPDGRTSYVHFAYATSADGSTGFSTTDPTGASYIGTYTDFTINDSTDYKSYTWSRMKGDTGNGIANTVIEYQITNTQDQPSDTSGWTTTIPNIGAGVYLWTRTTFVYTDGTKSRTYTVSRQSDNVYTAVLTNDSITLPADASGNVTDFSGSNGQFLVYDGAYQVDPTKVTIQVSQQVNVTVATGGSNYSITAMDKTKDSGYFDLSYTYKGVLLTKRVSVSKSKRGTDGSNPVIVNLSATSQVFTFDSNNKPYPVNQNINFYTTVSGTNATPVYSAIPYDENGTAGSAIVLGNYGTGGKQLQVAQIGNYQRVVVTVTAGGGTDSTTIARVKDGSSVSPIPDPSNTMSSATPPTNPKEGDWWNDTSQTPNVLKYRYRDKWVQYELDGYYVKANSISGEAIVTNTLEAQKIKYTNSDGTTTNLQTFDLKGIQTALTDSSGHTYTSMDNAVSSTQTWQSLSTKVNNLGQINQIVNSEFTPDFAGWYTSTNANPTDVVTTQLTPIGTDGFGSNQVSHKGGGNWINSAPIPVTPGMVLSFSTRVAVPKPVASGVPIALYIQAFDTNNSRVLSYGYNVPVNQLTATPTTFKIENVVMPAGAVKAFAVYAWNVGDEVYISQPMLVFSPTVGTYAPGNYNNNTAITKLQTQADGLSLTVGKISQNNLISNSEFRPDLQGWWPKPSSVGLGTLTSGTYQNKGSDVMELTSNGTGMYRIYSFPIPILGLYTISYSLNFWIFQRPTNGTFYTQLQYLDANMNELSFQEAINHGTDATSQWINITKSNIPLSVPAGAKYLVLSLDVRGAAGVHVGINQPILVNSSTLNGYTPGAYNNQQAVLSLQAKSDSFDVTVSKVNSLAVGGRNYILNSNGFGDSNSKPFLIGSSSEWSGPTVSFQGDGVLLTNPTTHTSGEWFYGIAAAWTPFANTLLNPGNAFSFSAEVRGTVPQVALRWGFNGTAGIETFKTFDINNTSWTKVSIVAQSQPTNTGLYFRIQGAKGGQYNATWTGGETLKFRNVKIEDGNLPSGWAPAPEDVNNSIGAVQGTANSALNKVNSLGQTNQLFNTEFSPDLQGWASGDTPTSGKWNVSSRVPLDLDSGWVIDSSKYLGSNVLKKSFVSGSLSQFSSIPIPVGPGQPISASITAMSNTGSDSTVTARIDLRYYDSNLSYLGMDTVSSARMANWTTVTLGGKTTPANVAYVSYVLLTNGTNGNNYYTKPMLVFGSNVGTYVQGNYNNNTAVVAAQSTATTAKGTADSALARANSLGQINQLFNTEFSPDFQGWYSGTSPQSGAFKQGLDLVKDTSWALSQNKYNGSNILYHNVGTGNNAFFGDLIPVGPGVQIMGAITAMSDTGTNSTVTAAIYLRYYDANKNYLSTVSVNSVLNSTWTQTTINSTTPANTAYVSYNLLTNGSTGINRYTQPMLVFDNKIGTYVQGNYNNNKYVSDVSTGLNLKLDSYTLGTTVDGKLVSGFTGNQQQVTIKGNMINLDANTVVGNNFILQSANIGDLTAGKIKTGSISGNNLSINLDTGSVLFQKGRIYSQGKEIDINIDQNYIRSYGDFGSISLENGAIYLSGAVYDKPVITDGPTIDLYLYIHSVLMPSAVGQPDGYIGAALKAKDFLLLGLRDVPLSDGYGNYDPTNLGTIVSRKTGVSVYGKDIGVNITGGSQLNNNGFSFRSPRIAVGFDPTKDPSNISTKTGDDLRSNGILLSSDGVVLADGGGTHGSITRDGIKTNNYTRYVTVQNDTQNLPLVMGLERIGNMVMLSFNFTTYGGIIQTDQRLMNGPKIPVGFRPVDNVHIHAHANNSGNTLGIVTFTITPDGRVLQTSPAIGGVFRLMGSGFYLTYSVSPSVGTKVNGSTGDTNP